MKKGLKARIASVAMACFMAVTATCGVASATTKKNCLVKGDKWYYTTTVFSGQYKSEYTHPSSFWGGKAHWTSVKNNKSGAYKRGVAGAGCTAYASVSANWFGPNGTVSCGLGW